MEGLELTVCAPRTDGNAEANGRSEPHLCLPLERVLLEQTRCSRCSSRLREPQARPCDSTARALRPARA